MGQRPPIIQSTNFLQRLMRSPIGNLFARSWLEKPILYLLETWFFPLSRLWAAARAANGSVDEFFAAVPMKPVEHKRAQIQKLLDNFQAKREQILITEQKWREAFYSAQQLPPNQLLRAEQIRLIHRNEYNKTRRQFGWLRKYVKSSVADRFATPTEVEAIYGGDQGDPHSLFAVPESMPRVEVSQSINKRHSKDYWLRFPSPSARMGDNVYARVLEPIGVKNPPTLLFGHGIGVEFDHWRNTVDFLKYLPQLGIRVIRPEAAWHGRRVPDGFYGGEYFLSTTPLSGFDFFSAQLQEWTVLLDWARSTSSGALAIGGSSLGAQTAQMASMAANFWPQRLQPDALFLMTHCAHLWEVALDGNLADIWNLHHPMKELGWNRRTTEQLMQKLDPMRDPCMPPDRIISVLGATDGVTPYHSGRRLQKLWELPAENCFTWPCGHFEVPLRMVRQHQPLHRLTEILATCQTQ
jgi:hypothetical protein